MNKLSTLIVTVIFTGCAPGSMNIVSGVHKAGKKVKAQYQSREQILLDLKASGKSKQDLEIEKQLLPKGGRVFIVKAAEKTPSASGLGGGSTELGYTTVDFMQININGEFYYACNELENEKQPQSIFSSIFGNPKYHLICNINKPIDSSFDLILQNYSKVPIGKYHISIPTKS